MNSPLNNLLQGPIECNTEYESVCETSQIEHEVEEDVTECVTEDMEKCEDVTKVRQSNLIILMTIEKYFLGLHDIEKVSHLAGQKMYFGEKDC